MRTAHAESASGIIQRWRATNRIPLASWQGMPWETMAQGHPVSMRLSNSRRAVTARIVPDVNRCILTQSGLIDHIGGLIDQEQQKT